MLPLDVDLLLQHPRLHGHATASGLYTEHLSWSNDAGQLYDLLPLPCTGMRRCAGRRPASARPRMCSACRIGIENASTLRHPARRRDETRRSFIRAVVDEADCLLHLDVNNILVNARNFGFDPLRFPPRSCRSIAHLLHPRGRPSHVEDGRPASSTPTAPP
jgi:uncharacterized protein (UPF0276 family)